MNKAKAWFIAARLFTAPWILVNTLLGITLAGFSFKSWMLSFTIVMLVLIAAHFINNWRDFVKEVDALEQGSKAKSYTAASQLLPAGILTVKDMKVGTVVTLILSAVVLFAFCNVTPTLFALYLLGVFCAVTYTDWFKPKGLNEIPLFLGHGFSATTFAYVMQKPLDMTGISAGVLLGLWAATMITLDQYPDVETDLQKRIRNLASLIFNAKISLSSFLWFGITAIYTIQVAMCLIGFLPVKTLFTAFLLPVVHITGIVLENDFDKGMLLFLGTMESYPLIMSFALLM